MLFFGSAILDICRSFTKDLELQKIKTIIFDLGGVIIDLDEAATTRAFADLSGIPIEVLLSSFQQEVFFQDFEKGLIDANAFRIHIKKAIKKELEDEAIDTAWNAMLGAIKPARIELLDKLKSAYQVMILSNTNAIHEAAFHKILKAVSGKDHLQFFVHKVYFSHEMGMRKPDAEIYQKVLKNHALNPAETLFLDDKLANLEGAQQCGIQTQQVLYPDQILEIFADA